VTELIACRSVRKVYRSPAGERDFLALDDVSLAINEGEVFVLLGPSGCGKSTLLDIIAGLQVPTSGDVLLDGKPVRGPGRDRAVVFQQYALFPWQTVLENVAFPLRVAGVQRQEAVARSHEALQLVRLAEFAQHHPGQLSGGMKQRVALARALAVEPKVLLLDEPFGALDAQTRRLMQEELVLLRNRLPLTALFVTHSIDEAIRVGDRVAVMAARPGRIKHEIEVPRDDPERLAQLGDEIWHLLKEEMHV
jgi:NitT/TauT family transport system ATP-binding protein